MSEKLAHWLFCENSSHVISKSPFSKKIKNFKLNLIWAVNILDVIMREKFKRPHSESV